MDVTIAGWGIELAFLRCKVGSEFKLAKELQKENPTCCFYGAYGHFDLAAIRVIESLRTPYLVILHEQVSESVPFRFFGDQNIERNEFQDKLQTWPAALAVVLKLQPDKPEGQTNESRWGAARHIQHEFPEDFVFYGLGFSELLFIAGGENIENLLKKVTQLRSLTDSEGYPLFAKTTTFPFISYDIVHSTGSYQLLAGDIDPVITISCQPNAEQLIAQKCSDGTVRCRNVFGKNDLVISWTETISPNTLAVFLAELRTGDQLSPLIGRTTTYLETNTNGGTPATKTRDVVPIEIFENNQQQDLFSSLKSLDSPSLRAGLSDLALRLSSCLRNPLLAPAYTDMLNTLEYIENLVVNIAETSKKRIAGATAARIVDLARAAINQRYAGLEFHPEILAHSPDPLLCDLRIMISAASVLPKYIFDKLIIGKTAAETWSGYLIFGLSYSPQCYSQEVLALPATSLFNPINEWWKITHEVAHAVYNVLKVETKIPLKIRDYLAEGLGVQFDESLMVSEVFANWFDWRYIFQRDTPLYIRQIWTSWAPMEIVWKSPVQYVARSFAVYACADSSFLNTAWRQNVESFAIPHLNEFWQKFCDEIGKISALKEFSCLNEAETKKMAFSLIIPGSIPRRLRRRVE